MKKNASKKWKRFRPPRMGDVPGEPWMAEPVQAHGRGVHSRRQDVEAGADWDGRVLGEGTPNKVRGK